MGYYYIVNKLWGIKNFWFSNLNKSFFVKLIVRGFILGLEFWKIFLRYRLEIIWVKYYGIWYFSVYWIMDNKLVIIIGL